MTQEIRVGDENRPVDAKAPWVLADALVQRVWDGGGLLYRVGEWWAWVGGKWRLKSEEEMGLHVMRELAQMWVRVTRGEEEVVVPVGPNKGMCEEVLWALRAQREVKVLGHPVWLTGQGDKPRAEDCVAFEDVVVAVKGEGVEVVGVRGPGGGGGGGGRGGGGGGWGGRSGSGRLCRASGRRGRSARCGWVRWRSGAREMRGGSRCCSGSWAWC